MLSASSSWPFFWAIENRLFSVLKRKCGLTCDRRGRGSGRSCCACTWLRVRSFRIHSLMKKLAAAIARTDKKTRAMTSCMCDQLSAGDFPKGRGKPSEAPFGGVRSKEVSVRGPCAARFGEGSNKAVSDRDSKKILVRWDPARIESDRVWSKAAFWGLWLFEDDPINMRTSK